MARHGTEDYLTGIPKPADVPPGRVVVHNHVLPATRLGVRGFRAWLATEDDHYIPCNCGWAPALGQHYRVRPSSGSADAS